MHIHELNLYIFHNITFFSHVVAYIIDLKESRPDADAISYVPSCYFDSL